MSETAFGKIWGDNEMRYSSMIAQTLLLSKSFRDFLLRKIGYLREIDAAPDKRCEWSIKTEYNLNRNERIDIFIDAGSFHIGIENKKWAECRDQQLTGYLTALKNRSANSVLIFLTPSRYLNQDVGAGICHITYQQIIKWIDKRIKDHFADSKSLGEFERAYLEKLREYLEVLELSPITEHEIDSLLHYKPCLDKLPAILKAIPNKDEKVTIEYNEGNYMLASEQIEGIEGIERVGDLVLFYGFRFSNNWYYKTALLNDSPECLVYLKYKGKEESPRSVDSLLQKIHDDLLSKQEWNIDKKDDGQFRLAVRRNLRDFKGKDNKDNIVEIEEWLLDAKQVVQDAIARFKD